MIKNILIIVIAVILFALGVYNLMQFELKTTYPENVVLKRMDQESTSQDLAGWIQALIKQKEYFQENRNKMRARNTKVLFPVSILLFIIGLVQLIKNIKVKLSNNTIQRT